MDTPFLPVAGVLSNVAVPSAIDSVCPYTTGAVAALVLKYGILLNVQVLGTFTV